MPQGIKRPDTVKGQREQKTLALPFTVKDINVETREVRGIFSVFGNVDDGKDVVHPGAFTKTIAERGSLVYHLWGHDFRSPPIAKVMSLRELAASDLPAEIRARYPEATGGAEVTRRYFTNPEAERVFVNLREGVPLQMSFGFDVVKWAYREDPNDEWWPFRDLQELRLYETSDVLWGMNEATIANAGKEAVALPLSVLVAQIESHLTEATKAGARHSAGDQDLINQIASHALSLGANNIKLVEAASEEAADGKGADTAATESRAGGQSSLTLARARMAVASWDTELLLSPLGGM